MALAAARGASQQRLQAGSSSRSCAPLLLRPRPSVMARSMGKDAVGAWMDLTSLVAQNSGAKSPYEQLANAIGRDVYVDVAGWHLYLRDMTAAPGLKMHSALATQFGPQAKNGLRESDVVAVLKKVPVKLGGGKTQLSLYDVMPSFCVADLTKAIEEYGRK